MKPILSGARGPAIEDIQKRLLKLGYALGPTGIDGVFLGKTHDAVVAFQSSGGLSADGIVGDATWVALVDATFTLGDRMLYLRLPHFHGHDVKVLQDALNTLGFSCGAADGIFGTFSERAVREFQRNCAQHADGIVGFETVRAIRGLRHIWEGKDSSMPMAARAEPARSIESLLHMSFVISSEGEMTADIAERVANVAHASNEQVCVTVVHDSADIPESAQMHLALVETSVAISEGVPVVLIGDDDPGVLAGRFDIALSIAGTGCPQTIMIDARGHVGTEQANQRIAVRLLDALCETYAK